MALKVGELYGLLRLDDKKFHKGLDKAEKGFGGMVKSISSNVAKIGSLLGTLATGAVAKLGIEFNSSMETAEIGFTTMLGSAEKADKFLRDLLDFAKRTPFEMPGLRDAASRLLAFQFEAKDIIPIMTAVGDSVAALGGNQQTIDSIVLSLGQMKATGRATWEEIRQLSENGVPALEILADAFGVTQEKMMEMLSEGAVGADEAITILTEGMNEKFGGMMENMETTWSGMVSNIKDQANILIGEAMEPVFTYIRDNILPVVQDLLEDMQEGFEAEGFKGALKALIPEGLKDDLQNVADTINTIKDLMQSGDWERLGEMIGRGLRSALERLKDFGGQLSQRIVEVIQSVDWAEVGRASVSFAAGFILGFVDGLLDPAIWIEIFTENWDIILGVLLGIIFAPAKWIKGIGKALEKIPFVGTLASGLLKKINEKGKSLFTPIGNFFKDMGELFMDGLKKGWKRGEDTKFFPKLSTFLGDVKKRVKDIGPSFFTNAGDWMENLGRGLGNKLGDIRKWFKDLTSKVEDWVSETDLYKVGRDIIQGLINGIGSLGRRVRDKAREIASNVFETIRNFFDSRSPSRLMIWMGKTIGQGLYVGMDKTINDITKQANEMAAAAIPRVSSVSMPRAAVATPQAVAGAMPTRPIVVHVPLNINDREFARATARVMLEEQQHLERQARRARGE